MQNLKKKKRYKWSYEQNRSRPTDLENELFGGGGGIVGESELTQYHTAVFKMDNQGPITAHRELCSIPCNNLNGKRLWRRIDTCVCITESLCCTLEINIVN